MATVEIRTKTGMHRRRAGLELHPTWSAHEVTDEQLAALRADAALEVRAPLAEVEAQAARVEAVESEALGLREDLAQAQARIAELEAEVEQLRVAHEETLRELEQATAPAPPAPTPTAPQS